jgi:hypothetical protein
VPTPGSVTEAAKASATASGIRNTQRARKESPSATFVWPAPRKAPWMTIVPPKTAHAGAMTSRNVAPSEIVSASSVNRPIRNSGTSRQSTAAAPSRVIVPAVATQVTLRARSGVSEPRF